MTSDSQTGKKKKRNPNTPRLEDELGRMNYMTTADVNTEVLEHLEAVESVARDSGHLKGTFVRRINCAVVALTAAVNTLAKRSGGTEDLRWLKQHNGQLEKEVKQLKLDVKRLTAALAKKPVSTTEIPSHTEEYPPVASQPEQVFARPAPVLRPSLKGKRKVLDTTSDYLAEEERALDDALTQRINSLLDERQRLRDGAVSLKTTRSTQKTQQRDSPALRSQTSQHSTGTTSAVSQTRTRSTPTARSTRDDRGEPASASQPAPESWTQVLGRKQRK